MNKLQIGDKIANRYEIHQILGGEGKSGMGIVYVCYDHEHKVVYALKSFQEKYFFSKEAIELFKREATVWVELEKYPYIVNAFWVESVENRLFVVLEYIAPDAQGRNSLAHYLGNLTLLDILKFSIQFCYGMEYAYSRGIDAHRDIKPDNIMITPGRTVKITDFGLVKAFQEIELKEDLVSAEESSSLSIFQSKGKRICGTLPYMAPEQFDGYADKRSDIYAFGVVLYQMITNGKLPFIGGDVEEYERLHKHEKAMACDFPLDSVIGQCLKKEPDKRYQDFSKIREELQKLFLNETREEISPPEITQLGIVELLNKGFALDSLGRFKEAIAYYDEGIRTNPQYAAAWNNKGYSLANLSRLGEAITCYDEAIKINPQYAKAYANKGYALVSLGRFEEAIICCEEAIKINPTYDYPLFTKGAALGNLGKFTESIACFREGLKINPRHAMAWVNLGNISFGFNGYHEALICVEEAIKINPNLTQAHELKQLILQQLGRQS